MIVMTPHATEAEVEAVTTRLKTTGVHVVVMPGEVTTAIGAIADEHPAAIDIDARDVAADASLLGKRPGVKTSERTDTHARSRHRRCRPHADRARRQGLAEGRPRR
jgi:hypothetical protein